MRPLLALGCALTLAACGGSDGKTGNAAAAASFTYGSATAASASQAGALAGPVTGAGAFSSAPGADQGLALTDIASLTEALLGASGYGVGSAGAAPSLRAMSAAGAPRALTAAGFDNPACVATTATGVTLTACTVTVDESSPSGTFHAVVSASGSVQYAVATRTLQWDLTVGETVTVTGTSAGTITASLHLAGSLTVGETTLRGHMGSELTMTAAAGGQTMRAGVDERVDVDVTFADAATCASRVTGGTLEARRVWTARPQGTTSADLPDAAAKVTWTACGVATVQLGTR